MVKINKCRWGFHKWSTWEEGLAVMNLREVSLGLYLTVRRCIRCGATQVRKGHAVTINNTVPTSKVK